MRGMLRRIARLESERAHASVGAVARAQAAACAELSAIMAAIAAERSAGDVHGIAGRLIADVLAALESQA
jgi:hypothetical protein